MEYLKDYLNFDNSYKAIYVRNNNILVGENLSIDTLFYNISNDVDIVLNSLNISASKIGYRYWKDAVFICIINDKFPVSICNEIYPAIASKYNKTSVAVERAMRLCFENVMYLSSKRGSNFVTEFLSNYLLFPRNNEILYRIVDLVVSKRFQEEKVNLYSLNTQS